MSLGGRVRSLERKDGPPEMTRIVLRDMGGGRYRHMGTGKTYTADEVRRMGNAVLIVGIQTVKRGAIVPDVDGRGIDEQSKPDDE